MLWSDEAACAITAACLATRLATAALPPAPIDAFIALHGPLGAGKTTFARHLLHALGVAGRIKSPTFTVMEPYLLPGGGEASHFDFFRFGDAAEWLDAGFRDVFARPGLKLAEWPDKAGEFLPDADLRLDIEPLDGNRRDATLHALTARGAALLAGWPQ